jgi:AraC-like DNA-binding protein
MMQYVSASLYRKMIHCAIAEGMRRDDFVHLPSPIEAVDKLQAVPADHFFALHEYLDEKLGPGFSVRVGRQMKIEDYGVLGLSWRTCSWAGEIFDRCERYFRLLSDTYVFQVKKEDELSHVYLFRNAHRRGVALSNEATFAATVVILQAMTESPISPVRVTFMHGPAKSLVSFEEVFRCPVAFRQPHNSISYRRRDLEMRTAKADASINAFLLARVEEATQGLEVSANRIAYEVEELIRDALPSGIPSIIQISEHMGMSNRTLTRRLAESGFSFRDLISKTQQSVAVDLLKNSSQNVSEIAFQTGFSEQSAFNRAFKRWLGSSPLEFRKNG